MSVDEQSVYIAGSQNGIKIGRSVNPQARVKDLSVGNPDKIELLTEISLPNSVPYNASDLERLLHQRCERWHKSGEWFETDAYHFIAGLLIGMGIENNLLESEKP